MKKLLYITLMALTSISCNGWFDTDIEGNSVGVTPFTNEAAFRDYMNGTYKQLESKEIYRFNLTLGGIEVMGQTLHGNSQTQQLGLMNFDNTTARSMAEQLYAGLYKAIYSCNDILERFEQHKDVRFVDGSKEMMMAEAKALRAFLHMELARLFCPAPVSDNGAIKLLWVDNTSGNGVSMNSSEMMAKVVSELREATNILKTTDPIVTGKSYDNGSSLIGTSPAARRWKMNYYAALAVRARANMMLGEKANYQDALTDLNTIMSSKYYSLIKVISLTDYSLSGEFLFGLPSTKEGFCKVSDELFKEEPLITVTNVVDKNALQANDRRRTWFDNKNTISVKFASTSLLDNWKMYPAIPVIKYGEVYLMAAESAMRGGSVSNGVKIFNEFIIERNSEAEVLPENASQSQLIAALDKQYIYEFLGEGVRFYYLKRLNRDAIAFDGSTITGFGNKCFPIVK